MRRRGEHAAAKVLAEEALRKARDLYHSLDEQVQLQALRRAAHPTDMYAYLPANCMLTAAGQLAVCYCSCGIVIYLKFLVVPMSQPGASARS